MSHSLKVTVLGCGSSPGVPRIGGDWGACDPENPKNRRRRCSILVQRGEAGATTDVLVDTSPDLREQSISASLARIDGVLYTHPHADHIHGIDDLRGFVLNMRQRVDIHANDLTMERLVEGFGYCFETPPGSDYPPILNAHRLVAGEPVSVVGPGGSVTALPIEQQHGRIKSLAFRFGRFGYSSDVSDLDERAAAELQGLDVWIVDALRYKPHPSHFSVDEALSWAERLKPKRTILTHMHVDLDYETLRRSLPEGVEPAYDGMSFDVEVD
ncbi:phosphoribosyl 1,2-cyclic phosphate phosphodiesterase [Faunimonas pinastri]|uniref:Phosphoribosyl 1,2-cyclic phosphate phosphodiesterase n=1 Tax=Faunimonas pinastri TaxID=1855383 RepID=A0A1H9N706_9HYPH|nr:MBL fold metallo-hydrolase [Faunimonas pinastri]SER31435.1 phosphoribosyl 1,2-cyclic phosphate phosphodiesterase [Faunimonas pinastri]